ncbi:MAG TPA: hypothetical protein VE035_05010 [Puia sp.]|nr:hypothetical protein [Puia sp.]
MNTFKISGLFFAAALLVNTSFAQDKTVTVGGAPMYPSRNQG